MKKSRSTVILALIVGLVLVLPLAAIPVAAQSSDMSGERIQDYTVDATISHDNTLQVTEDIAYDFGAHSKHGIFRDVPVTYHDGNNTYYLRFSYGGTSDGNGNSVPASISKESGNERIRLGDPDKLVSGVRHYRISYSLSPVLYSKDGQAFLNFDALGTGFGVPISNAHVNVRSQDNTAFVAPQCFKGAQNSSLTCSINETNTGTLLATATDLAPYQGVTINAGLPASYTTNYLVANQKQPLTASDIWDIVKTAGVALLGLVAVLGTGIVLLLRRWKASRKRHDQTVVAQYDPPATLTPAEVGHLEDDSSSMSEVTATIIDLARRGHFKITELPKTGLSKLFGGKPDYQIDAQQTADTMTTAERLIYDALLNGANSVQLSKIDKANAAASITGFKAQTKDSLEQKGYYAEKGGLLSRGNLTDEGAKEWALVDGFKLYINVVEKDRLAFTDAPERTPQRFSALLPYAIALGVEKEWAKQFEGIDISPATDWYTGTNLSAFSAATFASSLDSNFSSAVSSNTSFSSGGGSSGGGFGGGGGGSW